MTTEEKKRRKELSERWDLISLLSLELCFQGEILEKIINSDLFDRVGGTFFALSEDLKKIIIEELVPPDHMLPTHLLKSKIRRDFLRLNEREYNKMWIREIYSAEFSVFYEKYRGGEWTDFVLKWILSDKYGFIRAIECGSLGVGLIWDQIPSFVQLSEFVHKLPIFEHLVKQLGLGGHFPEKPAVRAIAYFYHYLHEAKDAERFGASKTKKSEIQEIADEWDFNATNFETYYNKISKNLTERINPHPDIERSLRHAIELLKDYPEAKKIAQEDLKLLELKK